MTKAENKKCEDLLREGIKNGESAKIECEKAEEYLADANKKLEAEIEQRKADQHLGYAQGIYQALSVIGFEHEDMQKLAILT